tara:strand:+ start:875 stop:1486 length:612 start_codon:yes stop_codon:yes gene_type:complete
MEHSFFNLSSGEDVFNSLNELNKKTNSTSFLISAVGDLSKVSFKCPLSQNPIILEKKLEIITLSGYLTSNKSHLHISVSDENCNVFGGHLLPGSKVFKSLDILIGEVYGIKQHSLGTLKDCSPIVDIYVLPNCPWSKRAIKLLDSHDIKYNYYLITSDEEFRSISNRTALNTFPQIFIKNKFIGGYSELSDLAINGNLIQIIK